MADPSPRAACLRRSPGREAPSRRWRPDPAGTRSSARPPPAAPPTTGRPAEARRRVRPGGPATSTMPSRSCRPTSTSAPGEAGRQTVVIDVAVADQDHLDVLGPGAQEAQTVDEFLPTPPKTGTGVEQTQAVAAEARTRWSAPPGRACARSNGRHGRRFRLVARGLPRSDAAPGQATRCARGRQSRPAARPRACRIALRWRPRYIQRPTRPRSPARCSTSTCTRSRCTNSARGHATSTSGWRPTSPPASRSSRNRPCCAPTCWPTASTRRWSWARSCPSPRGWSPTSASARTPSAATNRRAPSGCTPSSRSTRPCTTTPPRNSTRCGPAGASPGSS